MLLPKTSSTQVLFGSSVSMAFFGLLLYLKPSLAKVNVAEKELHLLQVVQHASIILQLQVGIALYNRQTAQELGRSSDSDDAALGALLIVLILGVIVTTLCKLWKGEGNTWSDPSLCRCFSPLSHCGKAALIRYKDKIFIHSNLLQRHPPVRHPPRQWAPPGQPHCPRDVCGCHQTRSGR